MNLVVDAGNSATKVGIFDHENLVGKHSFAAREELRSYLSTASFDNMIISSVSADTDLIASWAKERGKTFVLRNGLPLPIINRYSTPETLGMDRLAGVCGAIQLFPASNNLVIDAGTCITYDFVDKNSVFRGGGISPGLMMRFRAVHTFTAKLPLVTPESGPSLIGDSTESSIRSGVVNGILAEIEGIIQRYRSEYPDLKAILCGGDAVFFENQLKASIFAIPDLVLVGLNSILIHNVNHS
jgi:type III pantothenate kinase